MNYKKWNLARVTVICIFLITLLLFMPGGVMAQDFPPISSDGLQLGTDQFVPSVDVTNDSNGQIVPNKLNINTGSTKQDAVINVYGQFVTPPLTVSGNAPVSIVPGVRGVTDGTIFSIKNPLQANSVGELVQTAATIFSYLAVLAGVIALIWTGLQYILAQGKPERIKELKTQLLWVVVGIGIVIGARIMISIVINTLSASGVVNEDIINNANKALERQ